MISKKEREQLNDALEMSLSETSLILRTVNMLEKASPSICTVGELLNTSVKDLLQIPNFGRKSITQIYAALAKIGFERQLPADEAVRKKMPKSGTTLKETIRPIEKAMRVPLINTKLPDESCALLATGGILLVKDAVDCSEETLLFLLGQDSNALDAKASLIMLKRVLVNLGA